MADKQQLAPPPCLSPLAMLALVRRQQRQHRLVMLALAPQGARRNGLVGTPLTTTTHLPTETLGDLKPRRSEAAHA
jgi:hypothetical protein